MKYSIIIPTYNQLNFLQRCVDSVINNTILDSEIEIIIVCNGCKDGTLDQVKIYSSTHSNIKYIYWPDPLGFSKAVNAGLAVSTGEYVVLLNNDSYLLANNWLQLLQEPFIKYPDAGLTGPMLQKYSEKYSGLVFFCVMIKREVIQKLGYLDETFSVGESEDGDYSFKAIIAGYKLYQVPLGKEYNLINENTGLFGGHFPIVHESMGTRKHLPNINEVISKNRDIFYKRYNLT